jgi:hypothetical protein
VASREKPITPDHAVGYGRPPEATRFALGKSGNPKGRPKGSRSVGAMLQAIVRQKVAVTENGRTRRMTTLEVIFRRLGNDAMRGNAKAIQLLLSLNDRYSESSEGAPRLRDLLAEDREILARHAQPFDGLAADVPLKSRKEGHSDDV